MLSSFKQPGEAANWTGWLTPQDRRRTKWGPEEPPLFYWHVPSPLPSRLTNRQLLDNISYIPKDFNSIEKPFPVADPSRISTNNEPSNWPNNKQQLHFNQKVNHA